VKITHFLIFIARVKVAHLRKSNMLYIQINGALIIIFFSKTKQNCIAFIRFKGNLVN